MKIITLILLLINLSAFAKEMIIKVGLEEVPPVISQDGKGILNRLLDKIEKKTDYKFKITYMTYGRAVLELKKGRIDLIGMTPYQNETEDFYRFAEDLNWYFKTWNVLFYNKEDQGRKDLIEFSSIGTMPGNEKFISKLYDMPPEQFQTAGNLSSLFKMLKKDRIEGVLFESISAHATLHKLGLKGIECKKVSPVYGSFSIRKELHHLNKPLSDAFKSVPLNEIFEGFEEFLIFDELTRIKVKGRYFKEKKK